MFSKSSIEIISTDVSSKNEGTFRIVYKIVVWPKRKSHFKIKWEKYIGFDWVDMKRNKHLSTHYLRTTVDKYVGLIMSICRFEGKLVKIENKNSILYNIFGITSLSRVGIWRVHFTFCPPRLSVHLGFSTALAVAFLALVAVHILSLHYALTVTFVSLAHLRSALRVRAQRPGWVFAVAALRRAKARRTLHVGPAAHGRLPPPRPTSPLGVSRLSLEPLHQLLVLGSPRSRLSLHNLRVSAANPTQSWRSK